MSYTRSSSRRQSDRRFWLRFCAKHAPADPWERADYDYFTQSPPAYSRPRDPFPGEVEAMTGAPPRPGIPYQVLVLSIEGDEHAFRRPRRSLS